MTKTQKETTFEVKEENTIPIQCFDSPNPGQKSLRKLIKIYDEKTQKLTQQLVIHILLDESDRQHCSTGPAVIVPPVPHFNQEDKYYFIHGVNVPEHVVMEKDKITIEMINKEQNAEIRRVMLDFYGHDRYLMDSKFEVLDEDVDQFNRPRRLLRATNGADEAIVRVEVTNSTAEPEGTKFDNAVVENGLYFKKYYLPVHPELKPLPEIPDNATDDQRRELLRGLEEVKGQTMTCHNAVASTFGLRGEDYGLPGQFRQGDCFLTLITKPITNTKFKES